jgi:hypothetical protein
VLFAASALATALLALLPGVLAPLGSVLQLLER